MFDLYETHHDDVSHLDGSSNIYLLMKQSTNTAILEVTPTNSGSDSAWTPMPKPKVVDPCDFGLVC